jgi:hypothetical protein
VTVIVPSLQVVVLAVVVTFAQRYLTADFFIAFGAIEMAGLLLVSAGGLKKMGCEEENEKGFASRR